MEKYEIYETWQGCQVAKSIGNDRHEFLKGVYKGEYVWTSDYLYGKYYSLKTAQKHVKALERR